VSVAYDGLGYLCADTTGFGSQSSSRYAPDLSNAFTSTQQTGAIANIPHGVAADSSNDMIVARVLKDDITYGLQLRVFAPGGTITWTHEKPGTDWGFFIDDVDPTAMAVDGAGHVAIAGTYSWSNYPWIQVYTMP